MLACCCSVLVVKGGAGFSWRSFCSTLVTLYAALSRAATIGVMSASLWASNFLPPHSASSARKAPSGTAGRPAASASPFSSAAFFFLAAVRASLLAGFLTFPCGDSRAVIFQYRSEERRVGEERRAR